METLTVVCVVGFGLVGAALVYQGRKIGALVDELRAQRERERVVLAWNEKARGGRAFVPRS